MKIKITRTAAPTYKNVGEHWWCIDKTSQGQPYPVQIAGIMTQNGNIMIWYDVAGSDEGENINKAEWYGKIELPEIVERKDKNV